MAESRRLVKVFLASPGDLTDERKTAKLVVDEFNALLAEEFGYQVELVGWEDTVSVFGRPQATINRELDRCELFVGLMWKHWGTPPDITGTYSSGFEEEFSRSVARRLSTGAPEISLLFKEIAPEFLRDPGDELKKVLAFKNKLIAEKKIYFEHFTEGREFETKLRRCITTYIRNLRAEELAKDSGQSQSPTVDFEKQDTEEITSRSMKTPFSVEGAKFLREFITKTELATEENPIKDDEIARFRLLSTIIRNTSNDENSLGVHDSNLIFKQGKNFDLGQAELRGLVRSGLDQYSHENVPLWRWLAAIDGFTNNELPFYSVVHTSTGRQVNSLAAMKLISEPLPPDDVLERKFFLDAWFEKDTASSIKIAALRYLGECGITSDLSFIRQELDKNDNQTSSAAAEAFIRIRLRESQENAISSLFELQPSSISKDVIAELFNDGSALRTDILLSGVGHRNSDVRSVIVKLLRARRALPTEIAEKLLVDSVASVRFEALMSLVDNGRTFSEEDAKNILIKPAKSGMALYSLGASDPDGEACWGNFRLQRLRALKDNELSELANQDPILDRDPRFVLAYRRFKQFGDELRSAVDNQYKEEFSKWLDKVSESFTPELLEKARSLENFIRKDLTRKSLDIICEKANQRDLVLVRKTIKSGFVDYSTADIDYLRKFGEWEDIPLIFDSLKLPESGQKVSLLSIPDTSKYRTAARAIYALGRFRLNEVLTMPAAVQLLPFFIAETSDKAFRELDNSLITTLLRSENESIRKSTAIKCVLSLPKKRVVKLLNSYITGDAFHYYNVMHWLDFGISVPRDRALRAAEKVLNNEWKS
jgi:hypothetical protein